MSTRHIDPKKNKKEKSEALKPGKVKEADSAAIVNKEDEHALNIDTAIVNEDESPVTLPPSVAATADDEEVDQQAVFGVEEQERIVNDDQDTIEKD